MGNKTYDFSSKKKDFLPQNDQIWPKIGIFGQFGPGHAACRLIQCPVGGSFGGCGARAVSRKTPIYFIIRRSLRAPSVLIIDPHCIQFLKKDS